MPIPLIHQTDLFRPHIDPDDHWDLACVFALAAQGKFDLKGVLIDYPPRAERQPDVNAITQMNYIHNLSAPVVVGSSIPMGNQTDTQTSAPAHEQNGVEFILRTLRKSSEPVVIQIVGSCRDVALAANREPGLFREKCRAIYLNAGSGTRKISGESDLEYNVALNAQSYAAIFDVDCPIYWLPCFGEEAGVRIVREYGTWYHFQQKRLFESMSPQMRNYFAFMLGRFETSNWLSALLEMDMTEILQSKGEEFRDMWCTCGIFHIAGLTVIEDGHIVSLEQAAERAVFTFDPITVECDERGITRWSHTTNETNRYIFHIRKMESYESSVTQAMKTLLYTGNYTG